MPSAIAKESEDKMIPISGNIGKPALTLWIALTTMALTSAVFAGAIRSKPAQPSPPSTSLSPDPDADEIRRTIGKYAKSIEDADTTCSCC